MARFSKSSAVKRLVDGEWIPVTELEDGEPIPAKGYAEQPWRHKGLNSWQLPPKHQMPKSWQKGVKHWDKNGFAVMSSPGDAREFSKHTGGEIVWDK